MKTPKPSFDAPLNDSAWLNRFFTWVSDLENARFRIECNKAYGHLWAIEWKLRKAQANASPS